MANLMRGLLAGIAGTADAYGTAMKEQSNRRYEDLKAATLYNQKVSLESLRRQSNMEVAEFQAGAVTEQIGARGVEARKTAGTQAQLRAEAEVEGRRAMKQELKEEDILVLEAKIGEGLIDPEVGRTIVELRQEGIPMSELIPTPGKQLTPQQLEVLSKTAERINPEDPQAEFVNLQKQYAGATGGALGRGISADIGQRKIQEDIDIALIEINKLTDKNEAMDFLRKAKEATLPPEIISAAEAKVKELGMTSAEVEAGGTYRDFLLGKTKKPPVRPRKVRPVESLDIESYGP